MTNNTEVLTKDLGHAFDSTTNADKMSPYARMQRWIPGNWVVMSRSSSSRFSPGTTYQGTWQIVSIFANGDLRLHNGERVSSSSGCYKGASAQKPGNNEYRIEKVFATPEEARAYIAERKEAEAARAAERNAEKEDRWAKQKREAAERRAQALSLNPTFLTDIHWSPTISGQRYATVEIVSYRKTRVLMFLVMTQKEDRFWLDDENRSEKGLIYEVGMGLSSLNDNNTNVGACGTESGKVLDEVLIARLTQAIQHG